MAIRFKFARIADNISEEEMLCTDKEGRKKPNVRPVVLSDKTIDRDELVSRIIESHPRHRTEVYGAIDFLLEAITDVLKEGNILHIKGFGQFSVNAQFRKESLGNMDETSRGNSLEIKNVVFKADRELKQEIGEAGFEKHNPYKHGVRKYK